MSGNTPNAMRAPAASSAVGLSLFPPTSPVRPLSAGVQERAISETKQAQAQPGDVFPVSCHERSTEAEPGQVERAVSALLKHANLAFADKLPKPAAQFINTAELMGSRGRARMYGRPEPEARDHDYIVFTDDKKQHEQLRQMLQTLAREHGYKLHHRPSGFLTASGNNMDLSFYPTAKREQIHKAWALQESGMSKDDAWAQIESQKTAELAPEVQLQEHQQRVSDRIIDQDPRLLLYHGLGTGKSLSAIAAAEAAKKVTGGEYGVVVPASLRGNFQKELGKFTTNSKPEILSYSGLARGKDFKTQPETLVMDEAQRIKNPASGSATAARRMARNAKRLILLSGTPITNSPGDLASPLGMLRNEAITPEDFENRFVGYKKKFPGILPYLRGAQYGEEAHIKNEDQLREMLAGKVDYQPGKLPEGVRVNEETIKVPLSKEQQRIQKAVRTKIPPGFLWKLDQEFPLSREELSKLNSFMTGMRQVSLSTQPFRADKNPLRAFDQSTKLQEALKRLRHTLDSDPRRKAIVYSNFIDSGLKPYAAALDREKIPYGMFHGSIAPGTRQQALNDYNAGKLRALLLGPAAAEGISTKGTSLIQLLDPYWHESRTQQARGRGLRFDSHAGLPDELKDVAVQRYLSSSEEPGLLMQLLGSRRQRTGDEVIQHLADQKEQLNDQFRRVLREVGQKSAAQTSELQKLVRAAARAV